MEPQDRDLLKAFQDESKSLLDQMKDLLDKSEGDVAQAPLLEDYGNLVDRVMGGAKSLALLEKDPDHLIHKVADYAAICKAVGYKSSQVWDNEPFYEICVALLMDATEILESLIGRLTTDPTTVDMKALINQQLIDRLKWVSAKFLADFRASVDVSGVKKKRMSQNDIDGLLKKLGIG
ncbi:MAG: hypothetical protein C5B49_04865 [Bdellovibrio sp.]|nr:MAG: hypothetical protein C5B49_04865 [Bdellovibrio sp.]